MSCYSLLHSIRATINSCTKIKILANIWHYETLHSLKSRDFSLVQHRNTKNFYLLLKIIPILFCPTLILFSLEMPQMMSSVSHSTLALWTCCSSMRAPLIHSRHCVRFAFDLGEYSHHSLSVATTKRSIS